MEDFFHQQYVMAGTGTCAIDKEVLLRFHRFPEGEVGVGTQKKQKKKDPRGFPWCFLLGSKEYWWIFCGWKIQPTQLWMDVLPHGD